MEDPGFRKSIRDALARGVRVRLIKDAQPVKKETCQIFERPKSSDTPDCVDYKRLAMDIRANGGAVIPFNKSNLCGKIPRLPVNPSGTAGSAGSGCFQHGKMVISDSTFALISTGNFNQSNLCTTTDPLDACNRDFTAVINAQDIVRTLQTVFEHDLIGRPYDLAAIIAPVAERLTVSPLSLQPLLSFIKSARKSIAIANQYLHEPNINNALIEAAGQGIQVRVLVSSLCAFGKPSPQRAKSARDQFTEFDSAGIQSRFFTDAIKINGHPGYYHAKAIVVDGTRAWVGSVNGSTSAVSKNREFGIFFNDTASVQFLMGWIKHDFSDPGSETWRDSLKCAKDNPHH